MKTVETERLILRDFEERDAEPFFEFLSDRECCNMDGGYEPVKSFHSRLYKKYMQLFRYQVEERFMIELKEEHRCIGTVHVMEAEERKVTAYEIGYGICPSYQGKGYATEAVRAAVDYCFEELGAQMVTAKAITRNLPSRRVLEKTGFIWEGTLHKGAGYQPQGAQDYECYYMEQP